MTDIGSLVQLLRETDVETPTQKDWFENDELFARELAIGHRYQELVASHLREAGLQVEVTPHRLRESFEDRHQFVDEHDLLVGRSRPVIIDVKSRRQPFTSPEDYPFLTAFVDTVRGWGAKLHKPAAIVLVSQKTKAMLVIPASTEPHWTVARRKDHVRDIEEDFLEVRRELLRPLPVLLEWLQAREA